ncbi:MAG: trypsin-like serine protease [Proteobacteria bacterium]|nr:trypsin-like serine protease [Pseudomonadota bacterium]
MSHDISKAVDKAMPSCVAINIFSTFGGVKQMAGHGSGVIIDTDGHILTNAHVAGGGGTIEVETFDGQTFPAKLVGLDKKADVAVIKITPFPGIKPVTKGDCRAIKAGKGVFAIGGPMGETFSVSQGIISHSARKKPDVNRLDLFQTDTAINPGNSGGGLFNMDGELIGINTFIKSPTGASHGIGFAIKANQALCEARKIIGSCQKPNDCCDDI